MSFLEDLYLNGYLPSENDRPQTIEYAKACKKAQEYEEKIIAQFGEGFMDAYYTVKSEQVTMELSRAYAQGASFIIQLFLDGSKERRC